MKMNMESKMRSSLMIFIVTLGILLLGAYLLMKEIWSWNGLGLFSLLALVVSLLFFVSFYSESKMVMGIMGIGYFISHAVFLVQSWAGQSFLLVMLVWAAIWLVFVIIAYLYYQNRVTRKKLKDLKGA